MILVFLLLVAGGLATWLVLRHSAQVPMAGGMPASGAEGVQIADLLRDLCKDSPQAISLHLPSPLPPLPLPRQSVEQALSAFLEFFARRRARGILVAAGCGALSIEVVIADAGSDIADGERAAFLDWGAPTLPSRMGMDEALRTAHVFLHSVGGSISIEARLEGGVCLRCRIPRKRTSP